MVRRIQCGAKITGYVLKNWYQAKANMEQKSKLTKTTKGKTVAIHGNNVQVFVYTNLLLVLFY